MKKEKKVIREKKIEIKKEKCKRGIKRAKKKRSENEF